MPADVRADDSPADATGVSLYPGNISVLVCRLKPYSVRPTTTTPKYADTEKTKFKSPTWLECLMQDFPRLYKKEDKVGFTQLDRVCICCIS